jgi:hypothetical protein
MGEVVQHNQTLEPIPSWEGQKPKASEWLLSAKNPPFPKGDSQEQSNSDGKFGHQLNPCLRHASLALADDGETFLTL